MAVNNFAAEGATVPLDEMTTLIDTRVITGSPAEETMRRDVESGYEATTGVIATAGYRFLDTSESEHAVALVVQVPTSSGPAFAQTQVVVRWTDGDWKVWEFSPYESVGELPAGFVAWGPAADAVE